ncbi:hypothetical protein G9F72_006045 [Clostridium estertheticum]|nr:hypothetical protein [Clostridium estertheticum]
MLNSKYRGYFNYYGVIGNSKGLSEFYGATLKILYKWMIVILFLVIQQ